MQNKRRGCALPLSQTKAHVFWPSERRSDKLVDRFENVFVEVNPNQVYPKTTSHAEKKNFSIAVVYKWRGKVQFIFSALGGCLI